MKEGSRSLDRRVIDLYFIVRTVCECYVSGIRSRCKLLCVRGRRGTDISSWMMNRDPKVIYVQFQLLYGMETLFRIYILNMTITFRD